MSKIRSKNPIFRNDPVMIDKPKKAVAIYNAQREKLYRCPYCGCMATMDECDVMGAEENCLFCNQCNREFET